MDFMSLEEGNLPIMGGILDFRYMKSIYSPKTFV